MIFRKLEITDGNIINNFIKQDINFFGWENCFPVIWAWNIHDETTIFESNDFVILKSKFHDRTVFYAPYLREGDMINDCLLKIKEFCEEEKVKVEVKGIVKALAEKIDENVFKVTNIRDNADYIYSSEKLMYLKGKKLHAKRNYVNRFEEKYNYEFREYNQDDYDVVMHLYESWKLNTEHETLSLEKQAISRSLKAYKELNLKIGLLFVDGNLIGFGINHIQNAKIGHALFEKADVNFEGVYQVLNKFSAMKFFNNVEFINRQEDMGIDGLRKAKLSYYPDLLLEKYSVELY